MSAYSTKIVTRNEAEALVTKCRLEAQKEISVMSDDDLDRELNHYAYYVTFSEILGVLTNFRIN